jgi:hypothetical protein
MTDRRVSCFWIKGQHAGSWRGAASVGAIRIKPAFSALLSIRNRAGDDFVPAATNPARTISVRPLVEIIAHRLRLGVRCLLLVFRDHTLGAARADNRVSVGTVSASFDAPGDSFASCEHIISSPSALSTTTHAGPRFMPPGIDAHRHGLSNTRPFMRSKADR